MRTFKEMRKAVKDYRAVADGAGKLRDETIRQASEIYAGSLLEQKKAEANALYTEHTFTAKQMLLKDIEAFRTAKIEQLEKNVAKAPTTEQVNKLNELRNRKHLDADELQLVADSMSGSYGALRTLRDIADTHNHLLQVPDYTVIRDDINECCDYAIKMMSHDSTGYTYANFINDREGNMWDNATEPLDTDILCAIPKVERRKITDGETELLNRMFEGISPEQLPFEVNKASKSAEIKRLIELSDVYSPLLETDTESL